MFASWNKRMLALLFGESQPFFLVFYAKTIAYSYDLPSKTQHWRARQFLGRSPFRRKITVLRLFGKHGWLLNSFLEERSDLSAPECGPLAGMRIDCYFAIIDLELSADNVIEGSARDLCRKLDLPRRLTRNKSKIQLPPFILI